MSHELGHVLGLNHDGYQPHNCPIYPSLMSYTYQNMLDGRVELKGYSHGLLGAIVLNERKLSERLPVPIQSVRFLANDPYYYPLRPAGTVDPGRLELERNLRRRRRDRRHQLQPLHRDRPTTLQCRPGRDGTGAGGAWRRFEALACCCFSDGSIPTRGNLTQTPRRQRPAWRPSRPGTLVQRVWLGQDPDRDGGRWSEESIVEGSGLTGEPSAAYLAGSTWVAYPTAAGVILRRCTLDASEKPSVGPAIAVPASQGALPTLTAVAGRLALWLWRDAGRLSRACA